MFTHEQNESVTQVLSAFRDLCTFVWMLESRDSLSLTLRQKAATLKQQVYQIMFLPLGNACVYTQCYYMADPIRTNRGSKRVIVYKDVPCGDLNDVPVNFGSKIPRN